MRLFNGWINEAGDNDSRALNTNKDSILREKWKLLIKPVLLTIAMTSAKMETEPKLQLQVMLIQSEDTEKSPR